MPSTFSTSLRLELIGAGEQAGNWNNTTNVNLGTLLEQAIAGTISISMTDADLTLSAGNGVSDQARNAVINLTGSLTATRNVIVPAVSKLYIFRNSTNQSVIIKAATGTGVTIPSGLTSMVYWRGGNVIQATPNFNATTNSITASLDGNVTGNLTGNVTGSASNNLLKAGDTMTGNLIVSKATPAITLNKTGSAQSTLLLGQDSGSTRWAVDVAGPTTSDFGINRYNDSGVYVDTVLSIARATGAPSFANAGLWRDGLGAPALPKTGSGPGEFTFINPGLGAIATIPPNGTWAAFALRYGDGTTWPFGTYDGNIFAGVYAGGTNAGAGLSDRFWLGFCWRIT